MPRLRWSYPKDEEDAAAADWRWPALILATLFLNFPFWFIQCTKIGMDWPLPIYAAIVAVFSLLLAAFFVGPAVMVNRTGRSLMDSVALALGSVPAILVRLCCGVFLLLWLGYLIEAGTYFLVRNMTNFKSFMFGAILTALLFVTAQAGAKTGARQAAFSIKLGVAILFAAMIRVHGGWREIPYGFHNDSPDLRGFSSIAFSLAPILVLAASMTTRLPTRLANVKIAVWGIAFPLCATLLFTGALHVAVVASGYYTPSLAPSIAVALWGKAALSALPGRMALMTITIFGAVRFGVNLLLELSYAPRFPQPWKWLHIACFTPPIAWLFSYHRAWALDSARAWALDSALYNFLCIALAVVASVLTAEAILPSARARPRLVEPLTCIASVAGIAMYFYVQNATPDAWWFPGLVPAYTVSLFAVIVLRLIRQKWHVNV